MSGIKIAPSILASDFARLGVPLTLLVLVATPALVPIFFPFH